MRAALLSVCAAVPLGLLAAASQDPPPAEETHEETVLDGHMLQVKEHVRLLRRSLRKPEQAQASLATLTEMQVAAILAKQEVPRMAESLPEAERAAFTLAYRQEMVKFCEQILKVEAAVLAGDAEGVKASFDALRNVEDPAHERFTEGE